MDHEIWYGAVEDGSVIAVAGAESKKVVRGLGDSCAKQFDLEITVGGV